MILLADTHAVLWWLTADARLSARAQDLFRSPEHRIWWSAASSFEVAVKVSVGKLRLGKTVGELLRALLQDEGFELLPIENAHCAELSRLPLHHRDPFDRLLVAQARTEAVPLLTADPKLRPYDVEILW